MQLTEMMGGEIGVESQESKGSIFWFTVVLKKQTEKLSEITPLKDNDLLGLKILLVDDNHTNLTILEAYFKSWGCDPAAVSSGREALGKLRASIDSPLPFNLILTDHHMPEMDGFELVEEIRAGLQITTIPVVMLTSSLNPGDGRRLKERGINGYLAKPIRRDELKNAMKTVLGFPLHEKTMADQNLATKQLVTEKIGGKILRVLLVEDYQTNQQVAAMHLEGAGFKVELAENGRQAVEAYKSRSCDIILMDIQMPEMDGYEATRLIREFEQEKEDRTPIIAMTAHASEEDREKCLTAGMDDFISKPLRRRDLLNILEKWLGTSGAATSDTIAEQDIGPKEFEKETEAPPMDFNFALGEFRGDRELLAEVSKVFIENAKERVDLISSAIAKGDSEIIKNEGHTLKGGAGTIGAKNLAEIAYELEKAGKDENLARSIKHLDSFQRELERLAVFMKDSR